MTPVLAAAVLSTLSLDGDAAKGSADYITVEFEVPEGTVEFEVVRDYSDDEINILDFGVWSPSGFRGWNGGSDRPIVVGEKASSSGFLTGTIAAGTWVLVIGRAELKTAEVTWTADIEFRDEATLPQQDLSDFAPTVLASEQRWYRGDFHVHSDQSTDATATMEQILTLARDQGLEFAVLSDHNTTAQHHQLAGPQGQLDDLLLMRGNEITTYGGHGNALGATEPIDFRIGVDGRTADDILDDVEATGGSFIVNHPSQGIFSGCIGCSWEHDVDMSQVVAVEVHSAAYEQGVTLFIEPNRDFWELHSAAGHKLAAVGGSDDHRAGIDLSDRQSPIGNPTTLVYADELSEAGIMAALQAGRTVVQMIGPDSPFAEFAIRGAGSGEGMIGDTVSGHEVEIEVTVQGGDGSSAFLFVDGEKSQTELISGSDWTHTFTAPVAEEGSRYHIEISNGAPLVITSHAYATYEDPPANSGCGCRTGGSGAGTPAVCALTLLLLARRGRRRG